MFAVASRKAGTLESAPWGVVPARCLPDKLYIWTWVLHNNMGVPKTHVYQVYKCLLLPRARQVHTSPYLGVFEQRKQLLRQLVQQRLADKLLTVRVTSMQRTPQYIRRKQRERQIRTKHRLQCGNQRWRRRRESPRTRGVLRKLQQHAKQAAREEVARGGVSGSCDAGDECFDDALLGGVLGEAGGTLEEELGCAGAGEREVSACFACCRCLLKRAHTCSWGGTGKNLRYF